MVPLLHLLCFMFPPTGEFFFTTNASEYDDILIYNYENQEYLEEFLPGGITKKGTAMVGDPATHVGIPMGGGSPGFHSQSNGADLVADDLCTDNAAVLTGMPSSSSYGIGSSKFSESFSSLPQFDRLQFSPPLPSLPQLDPAWENFSPDLQETNLSRFETSPHFPESEQSTLFRLDPVWENLPNERNAPTSNVEAATLPCGERPDTEVAESMVVSKGIKWSEEEHKSFLKGMQLYGRSWKSIANNVLLSRTPDQISCHAHKFFKRLQDPNPKRRKSINDITTLDGHRLSIYDIAQWCNINRKEPNNVGHIVLSPPTRNN